MPQPALPSDPERLRGRAVWLYYAEGRTQSEVATRLGISRVMVVRLLAEARRRNEIRITIASPLAELAGLAHAVEERFSIRQVILAPQADPAADPTAVIAAAAGNHIAGAVRDGMTVGVGWGRTLYHSLPFITGTALADFRVVSLLGGVAAARRFNPAEFAWKFAELFQGEGYLIPAPAVVDSPATKAALIERCGLAEVLALAERLDLVLLSCGGIDQIATGYRAGHITTAERHTLAAAGAVGDVLYNFIAADGRLVDHPLNQRVLSAPLDRLRRAPRRVLVSGGPDKRQVLPAAIRGLAPTVLITDEQSARALLEPAAQPAAGFATDDAGAI